VAVCAAQNAQLNQLQNHSGDHSTSESRIVEEIGTCFLQHLSTDLEYACRYESMQRLLLRDERDFMIAQSAGHAKTCFVTGATEHALTISNAKRCLKAYPESDIEDSHCFTIAETLISPTRSYWRVAQLWAERTALIRRRFGSRFSLKLTSFSTNYCMKAINKISPRSLISAAR